MENKVEVWKKHPDIPGIEVSTLGRVRTLDRVVSTERGTWFFKGLVLGQRNNRSGYLLVSITIDRKRVTKSVHRLVAQTFIPNPDNLPQVNHKNCIRDDNRVNNLEWCDNSYNVQYREKYGEAQGHHLFAVNLDTLEVSRFRSQNEASRLLGVDNSTITKVIKGKRKQARGYWFKEDDGNGIEIDKDNLNDITDGVSFTGGVFAVDLNTLEVSRFKSQSEASRELGVFNQNVSMVIKGNLNHTHGFWFVKDDSKAVDLTKNKLHELGKTKLTAADEASADFVSRVLAKNSYKCYYISNQSTRSLNKMLEMLENLSKILQKSNTVQTYCHKSYRRLI